MSSNASDSESSSPEGGRTSSLGGYAFDGAEPPGLREAVQLIGGDRRLDDAFFKQRTPIRQLRDQRGLSTSSSFKLVSTSSTSSSSHHQLKQLPNRRRRPPARTVPAKNESRPSSSLSGRSSSLSGIRSWSSSQLSYHEDAAVEGVRLTSSEYRSSSDIKLMQSGSTVEPKSPVSRKSKQREKSQSKQHRKNALTLGKRIEKPRKAVLRKLLLRPRISIKKRTLFLSYMVTHGSGVLVSGHEFSKRTGFAQINALGKLVSSLCRMSDSDMSDSQIVGNQLSDSQFCFSQIDDSHTGGEGTLVPNGGSKEVNEQEASSDEASPLRSESAPDDTDVTLLDDDEDRRTQSSSSGKSCDKDSLYDDDDDEELVKDIKGSRGSRSRAPSGMSESSIEMNQQSFGYNDGFLLQSFLSRSFSLENYRRSQERAVTSSSGMVPDGDSDDGFERCHSLREIHDVNSYEVGAIPNGDTRRFNPVATFSALPDFLERDLRNRNEDHSSSRRNKLPLVPSFDQRRDELQGQHDRHLAEYTIAYGEDQSAPLHLHQFGHQLSRVILESGMSELGGNSNGNSGGVERVAEEIAPSVISTALLKMADSNVARNLDEISTQMSDQIIKESQESLTNICYFADQISCNVISSSLNFFAHDLIEERGKEAKKNVEGSRPRLRGGEQRYLTPHMESVEDQFVDSWSLSPEESLGEDNESDSIEQNREEEESGKKRLTDLPLIEKTDQLSTVDACVGSSDCFENTLNTSMKVVSDACTQTGSKEVSPSSVLDDRYLEDQWYPVSENEDGNLLQDAVAGLWKAFSQELESNSQFLRSDEVLEYFSESGGMEDAVDVSSSISLRDHLQSQLSSSVDVTIPQSLGEVSLAHAVSSSRRSYADDTDISSQTNFEDQAPKVVEDGIFRNLKASLAKNASSHFPKQAAVYSSEMVSSSNPDVLSLSSYADLPQQLSFSASKSLRQLVDLNSTIDSSFSTSVEEKEGEEWSRGEKEQSSNLFFVDSDEDLEQRVARILNDTHEDMLKHKRDAKRSSITSRTPTISSGRESRKELSHPNELRSLPLRSGESFVEDARRKCRRRANTNELSIEPISSSVASTSLESLSRCFSGTDPFDSNLPRAISPDVRKKCSLVNRRGSLEKALRDSEGVGTEEEMLRRMISHTDRILLETLDSDSDMSSLLSMGAATKKEDSGIFSTKCSHKKSTKKPKRARSTNEIYTSSISTASNVLGKFDGNDVASLPVLQKKPVVANNSSSAFKLDLSRLSVNGNDDLLPQPRGALSARPKLETAYDEDELILKAKSSLSDEYALPTASLTTSSTLLRVRSHYDRIDSGIHQQYSAQSPSYATLTKSFVAFPSSHSTRKTKHLSPKEHRIILANIRKSLVEASKDLDRIS